MLEKQALFWIFIAIFTITATITLLGITGVIKTIKEQYLKALFTALILEVVAAVIVLFNNMDFSEQQGPNLQGLLTRAGVIHTLPAQTDHETYIIDRLREGKRVIELEAQLDSLTEVLESRERELAEYKAEMAELDKSFYIKITRLRDQINEYNGFINIAYQEAEKQEVFRLLIGIFETLGRVSNDTPLYLDDREEQINTAAVKKIYTDFRTSYGRPIEDPNLLYIDEYDTIQMLRTYLNIIQPVR